MRLVTKYTHHDFTDPEVDAYPVDDAVRIVKKMKPYLIGKVINQIVVNGLMCFGSGILVNETIYDFEKHPQNNENCGCFSILP